MGMSSIKKAKIPSKGLSSVKKAKIPRKSTVTVTKRNGCIKVRELKRRRRTSVRPANPTSVGLFAQ
jgi:hypothetical protein